MPATKPATTATAAATIAGRTSGSGAAGTGLSRRSTRTETSPQLLMNAAVREPVDETVIGLLAGGLKLTSSSLQKDHRNASPDEFTGNRDPRRSAPDDTKVGLDPVAVIRSVEISDHG